VATFGAVLRIVRATPMLALVPSEILLVMGSDLACFEPPVPVPTMTMQLMWHPRHTTQSRHRALRRRIAEVVSAAT
jgi:DNA-binding transcriptional LysR family regulator